MKTTKRVLPDQDEADEHPTTSKHAKQPKLTGHLLAATSQSTVVKLIVDYIVEEMKPLRTVETDSFCRLVKGLCPSAKIPTRVTVKENVMNKFTLMSDRLKSQLLQIPFVCTTADLWSFSNRSFLGMTIHWIDPGNLKRMSAAIACKRFKDGHTYDKIATAIYEIHCRYGIVGKVVRTITDNGSNMVKAFTEYGETTPNNADSRARSVEDTKMNTPTEMPHVSEDDDDELQTHSLVDILNRYQNSDVDGEEDEPMIVLPPHMRCCSHTLNLVATTDVSKGISTAGKQFKKVHNQSMAKASALWNLTSCSTKASDAAFEILG
jgi:hypothetical protein